MQLYDIFYINNYKLIELYMFQCFCKSGELANKKNLYRETPHYIPGT